MLRAPPSHIEGCRAAIEDDSAEFISGAMAALVNVVITFPMNKIMFRQMVHGFNTPAAVSQLKNEGLAQLYKGCLPPLIQKTVSTSIMFGTYAAYQRHLSVQTPHLALRQQKLLAALLAGTTEALLCPLERAQCLLQDVSHQHRFRNTAHVFSSMRAHGLSEYYRGLSAVLLRNGPSTMLFFCLRDRVRTAIPVGADAKSYQGFLADFLSGSLVGAFVSTLVYPVNVIKTHMQVQYGTPHLTLKQALQQAFESRDRSLRKLFYGVHLNYSRALLSWGITNAAYEVFKKEYELRYRACHCPVL